MGIRRHPITGDPIIFAPERAGRPNAFAREQHAACPFCLGNESETPPEITHRGDPWQVRAFPNKYPAVDGHEVIVESPDHGAQYVSDPLAVDVYVERYRAHSDAAHVALFRNHGPRAGASIDHLHSQLMPLTFVPPRIEREAAAFARAERCPLCAAPAGAVIEQDEHFTWVAPHGSSHVYQQWIVPRRHQPDISSLTSKEIASLAHFLERSGRATARIAPSANVLFMSFLRQPAAHFYVETFPRMTAIAGFELATGTFIDIVDPDDAALKLKPES